MDAPPEIQSYIDDVIAPTTPTDPILGVPKSAELTRVGADVAIVTSDVALPFTGLEDLEPFALLPPSAEYPYELAMSFEKGNELSSCVNLALASLEADGTLAALEDEWVGELDSLPRLSE